MADEAVRPRGGEDCAALINYRLMASAGGEIGEDVIDQAAADSHDDHR
jgi:hypothetical protein